MTGVVEMWREPDGRWRWRWRGASGEAILANQSWGRIEDAQEAAARAYPGETIVLLHGPPHAPPPRRQPSGAPFGLLTAAAIALLVGIAIAIARRGPRPRGRSKPTR